MLRLIALIGLAAICLLAVSGCSWQQRYLSAQGWQRNQCYRVPDETQRERCLANTTISYDDYRRQTKKELATTVQMNAQQALKAR